MGTIRSRDYLCARTWYGSFWRTTAWYKSRKSVIRNHKSACNQTKLIKHECFGKCGAADRCYRRHAEVEIKSNWFVLCLQIAVFVLAVAAVNAAPSGVLATGYVAHDTPLIVETIGPLGKWHISYYYSILRNGSEARSA